MPQCLRCKWPHPEASLFCERCQGSQNSDYQQKEQPINTAASWLACEEVPYIRAPKLLKLPMRKDFSEQERKLTDQQKFLGSFVEIKTPRLRYNAVMLRRWRTVFAVLVVLALVTLVVDSILVSVVIAHKSGGLSKANTPYGSSSMPLIIPAQTNPVQTSTIADSTYATTPNEAKKSSAVSNALTGPLSPSQAGGEPALAVSSNSLGFSLTQEQVNPAGQIITIVNTGVGTLNWLDISITPAWLTLSPLKGSVAAGQSGQIKVDIVSASLSPGTYHGQLSIMATDSAGVEVPGSPQIVSVILEVKSDGSA